MREAKKVLRKSIILSILATAFVSITASFLLNRSTTISQEEQNSAILHNLMNQIIKPSLTISDYGEVKRILNRINTENTTFAIVTNKDDIILNDDTQKTLIKDSIIEINKNICLESTKTILKVKSGSIAIACTSFSDEKYLIISVIRNYLFKINSNLLFMLIVISFLSALFSTLLLDRLINSNIITPLKLVSDALSVHNLKAAKQKIENLNLLKMPYEISSVGQTYRSLLVTLELEMSEREKLTRELAINELAEQIVHDIKSPIAALDTAYRSIAGASDDIKDLIFHAISRIKNITNTLLKNNKKTSYLSNENINSEQVFPIIIDILAEKKIQFSHKAKLELLTHCDELGYSVSALINRVGLERILSNLINNSAESILEEGKISLTITYDDLWVSIDIIDNGSGIPQHILNKIGERRLSFGKETQESGSGLGLYHAYKTISQWGGTINITSKENSGTVITIKIPRSESGKQVVPYLVNSKNTTFIVLDEDINAHDLWKKRLQNNVYTFVKKDLLITWLDENTNDYSSIYFIINHELINEKATVVEIIETIKSKYKIDSKFYIITNKGSDLSKYKILEEEGINFIQKIMIPYIPIRHLT